MNEINKLRKRLANVAPNAIEYKMSIKEATALLNEIEYYLTKKEEPPKEVEIPTTTIKILDGGTF